MEFNLKDVWSAYIEAPTPSLEESYEILKKQGDLCLSKEDLSQGYIQLQKLYKFLFGLFFIARSGIYKVDEKLMERGHKPAKTEEMDFFQKYDMLGLRFIYLRSWVHVERLSKDECEVLLQCLQVPDNSDVFRNALNIVEKTYSRVLMVNPEKKNEWFEIFPSIRGEGRVHGENIVFAIKTTPQFNEQGMFVDLKSEQKKSTELNSISRQLEPILSKALGVKVIVVREG